MDDNRLDFTTEADPRITNALRAAHAPPTEAGYWTGLESRVLARIGNTERIGWWQVAAGWARPGLAAAAVLLAFAAAAASMSSRPTAEQIVAYEAFAPAYPEEPVAVYTEADVTTQREATLRLIVAH